MGGVKCVGILPSKWHPGAQIAVQTAHNAPKQHKSVAKMGIIATTGQLEPEMVQLAVCFMLSRAWEPLAMSSELVDLVSMTP